MPIDASDTPPVPADPQGRSGLFVLYAGAIVVAGLYFGRELVVPLVLASLLAFVLAPASLKLRRAGLPHTLAVTIVVILAFGLIGGLGTVVGRQAASVAADLPTYQTTLAEKVDALRNDSGLIGRAARALLPAQGKQKAEQKAEANKPGGLELPFGLGEESGVAIAKLVAQPLLGPLETGGIVLVFTIFILMSGDDLRDRLVRLVGRQDLHRTILAMSDAARRLSQYFLFQLALNSGFGALVGVLLWAAGLPHALLWGILAGLMRFVPYIGVFIALTPPLLLAVAVEPGWTMALLVLALFVGAEAIMGQVVEPLIYGHSTGLSPLAVIVATAFWALLWGPIGLLIATPLTVCLVVIGRHVESLAFFEVLLGDAPPLAPPETFYQRALEGHALDLMPDARRRIAAGSLTDYYDTVALPGLALAQDDLVRDPSAFERLESIHEQISLLLGRLPSEAVPAGSAPLAPVAADWRRESAVLCIPGRGQLDDLAAAAAVQAMTRAGFGARQEPNAVLAPSSDVDLSAVRLCCLSVLEQGSTVASIRYFVRRSQKRMPGATIVVGLWHAGRDSALLTALRQEGGQEHLVLSLGELIAFTKTLSVRAPAADTAPGPLVTALP